MNLPSTPKPTTRSSLGFPQQNPPLPIPLHVHPFSHISYPRVFKHHRLSDQIFSGWQPRDVVEWQVNRRFEGQIGLRHQENGDGPRKFGLFAI